MKKLFTFVIAIFCAAMINAQMSESGNGFFESFTYDDGYTFVEGQYEGIGAEWPEGAEVEGGMLKLELGAGDEGSFGLWGLSMDLSENTDIMYKYKFPADGEFSIWVEDNAEVGGEVFPEDMQQGLSEMMDYTLDLTAEEYVDVDLSDVAEIWIMQFSAAGGTVYLDDLRIGDGTFVGIRSNLAESGLVVYPNPAAETFRLNADAESLSVFNAIGQVVKSVENYQKGSSIDISELEKGLYIINADNRAQKLMVK
jgi:hypothetical protein